MTGLTVTVHGMPAPQGSKRHVGNGVMIESSKAVGPWRAAVKDAAVDAIADFDANSYDWVPLNGPVELFVRFHFARPKGHYGTGKNAGKVKLSAPIYPAVIPDLSKLVRSTEDALTEAGVWRDDALVVEIRAYKYYDVKGFTGAFITVNEFRRDLA